MVTCPIQGLVAVVKHIRRAVPLPVVRLPVGPRPVEEVLLHGQPKVQDREWSHQAAEDLGVVESGQLIGRRERKPSIRCDRINKLAVTRHKSTKSAKAALCFLFLTELV